MQRVKIAFAASDDYCPQLSVLLKSLICHASQENFYEILVLHRGITQRSQSLVRRDVSGAGIAADSVDYVLDGQPSLVLPNISLAFYDVSGMITRHRLETRGRIGIETYFRFLIQDLFPQDEKVVYLDSDLIIQADVADLFQVDVEGYCLAAVPDADFMGQYAKDALSRHLSEDEIEAFGLRKPSEFRGRAAYAEEELSLKDPYEYFQAGVLVLNLPEMRKLHSSEEWLELCSVPHWFNDQDVLNMECQGRVRFLDYGWNVMMDQGRKDDVIAFAPQEAFDAYMASRRHPKIIHFAGGLKPWNSAACDFSQEFWFYARQSLYYEELLAKVSQELLKQSNEGLLREVWKMVAEGANFGSFISSALSRIRLRVR